jgi:hypothetical protein
MIRSKHRIRHHLISSPLIRLFLRHIARALQAVEVRRQSRAQVTLNIVESQIARARTRIFSATSRDVLCLIRDELGGITTTLRKVKHKVSSIVSRRSQLEASCDEMHRLLTNKENDLPVSSQPAEFDSCEFYAFPPYIPPTNVL